jgi:hypothetical protein
MFDAQMLSYELVLSTNIVVECDVREWINLCVGWRAGLAVAKEARDDDEVLGG